MIQAARLYEESDNDPRNALSCYKRAFTLTPDDRNTEKEIRRLAESLDSWQTLVEAYEDTIANLDASPIRTAELHFERGTVLEERLSDRSSALSAYIEAARLVPERLDFVSAAVRTAAVQSDWNEAAQLMSMCMRTRDQIEA